MVVVTGRVSPESYRDNPRKARSRVSYVMYVVCILTILHQLA